jgi:hypothetical protein
MTFNEVRKRVQLELDTWATQHAGEGPDAGATYYDVNQLFESLADATGACGEEIREAAEEQDTGH